VKTVILVLVCVALVGCPPRSPINPTEPCLPAQTGCIVSVDGISLIRAPAFWLLDLRGRSGFDVAKVIDAARQCDGPRGCGVAMTRSEIEALDGELAQAKVEKLSIAGEPAAAYRLDPPRIVIQGWAHPEKLLPQLPPVPSLEGAPCIPGQCELPPPIPPREHLSSAIPPFPR